MILRGGVNKARKTKDTFQNIPENVREVEYICGIISRPLNVDEFLAFPGQVHREACLKVDCLEEGGGVGGDQQEQGGQVGGQQLRLDIPLQGDHHVHLFLPHLKLEVCDCEHDQVFVIELQLLETFGLIIFVHHHYLDFCSHSPHTLFYIQNKLRIWASQLIIQ